MIQMQYIYYHYYGPFMYKLPIIFFVSVVYIYMMYLYILPDFVLFVQCLYIKKIWDHFIQRIYALAVLSLDIFMQWQGSFCVHPANERRRYNVTSSLIGWAHTQHDPCRGIYKNALEEGCMLGVKFITLVDQTHVPGLNTTRPRQNGSHFADNFSKCVFFFFLLLQFR